MQKILFAITKSNWGGAQRYVFDLANSLPKQDWSIGVVLGGTGLPGAAAGRLEEQLRASGIRTVFIPAFMRDFSLGADWQAFRQMRKLFATEHPDVVHLNSSKAGGLGVLAARMARIKMIVFTVHGLPWNEDRGVLSRLSIRFASWLTFLLCHRVIVVSHDALEQVGALPLCSKKVRLVHNGVAPLEFLSREEARTQLGIAPDIFYIGAVGELTWNKGYHVLLRAAETLKRQGKKFNLLIIGEGEERKFIETMIEEEELGDTVRLAGFVADAYRTLKAFDMFVLPSVKEGLPYVLIEAGLAGLPVVASKVGGTPDLISGGAGLLAEPKNHNELADRIATLMDDPSLRSTYSSALHNRATTEFSIEHMVEGTVAVYRHRD